MVMINRLKVEMKLLILILVLGSIMFMEGCKRRGESSPHKMREQGSDMRIAREVCASQTNANLKVRRIVGAKVKAGQSDAPCIPDEDAQRLSSRIPPGMSSLERAKMASDKNQVMDDLLNRPTIPADYGEQMVSIFRDRRQDVVSRDFAVQHIGLYAQTLNRRGTYRAESSEARALRKALDEAAAETKTIVAAAAFRALADLSAFDPHVDVRRLDACLVSCAADATAAPAARVMAVQLCGERKIAAARPAIAALAAATDTPTPLRLAASHSLSLL